MRWFTDASDQFKTMTPPNLKCMQFCRINDVVLQSHIQSWKRGDFLKCNSKETSANINLCFGQQRAEPLNHTNEAWTFKNFSTWLVNRAWKHRLLPC